MRVKDTFVQKLSVKKQIFSKSVGAKSMFLKICGCSCIHWTHTNEHPVIMRFQGWMLQKLGKEWKIFTHWSCTAIRNNLKRKLVNYQTIAYLSKKRQNLHNFIRFQWLLSLTSTFNKYVPHWRMTLRILSQGFTAFQETDFI